MNKDSFVTNIFSTIEYFGYWQNPPHPWNWKIMPIVNFNQRFTFQCDATHGLARNILSINNFFFLIC